MSELVERLRSAADAADLGDSVWADLFREAADRIVALGVFAAEVYDLAGPSMDTERHLADGAPLTQVALDQLRHRIETLEAKISDLKWAGDPEQIEIVARARRLHTEQQIAAERERCAKLAAPVLHYLDWQREVQAGAPLAAVAYSRQSGEVWRDVDTFAAAIRADEPPGGPWTRSEIEQLEALMQSQSDPLIAKGLRLALRCLPSRDDLEWAENEARKLFAPEETP